MSGDEFQFASDLLSETNEDMRDRGSRVESRVNGLEREEGICPEAVEVHPQRLLMVCKIHPSFREKGKNQNLSPWLCPPNCYRDNWEKCPYREVKK